KCPGNPRESFIAHPGAILFLRFFREGAFQQPRLVSTATPNARCIAYNWPMKKALPVSSFVVVFAGILAAQATPSRSQEDRQMPTVTMPFAADDGHGRPITGFSSSDLSLFDDKQPVQRIVAL